MTWIRRGIAIGAGFGLSAAAMDLWYGMISVVQQRMAPAPATLAQNTALLTAVGAALGLLTAPLLRSRARTADLVHLAAIGAAWLLVESWVWVDSPLFVLGACARTFGAGAIALLALVLARFARRLAALPWAFAALAAAAGGAAPAAYLAKTTPPEPAAAALPAARPDAPDVVLVVLDTVRAQSVGSYQHERDTSPTFDALAAESVLFADATSPSTWSLPSHASLFTGRYPTSHGANRQPSYLDDRYPTLAEVLAARGYETLCFTANPWISDGVGLTRGFAVKDLSWKRSRGTSFTGRLFDRVGLGEADKGGAVVADDFTAWLRARPADGRPAFVFLNFLEAHFPYDKLPAEFRDRFTDLPPRQLHEISLALLAQQFGGPPVDLDAATTPARALYDGGVAYTDELLHRVVSALRARGTLDRTVLVVLADHGELLGERGHYFGHGPSLYQQVIHVPLLVRYPPRIAPGTRVEAPVSTLGVFATILDLAGVEPPPTLQVGSLSGTAGAARDAVLSELVAPRHDPNDGSDPQMLSDQNLRAYRSGSWKLVETNRGGPFLYDLARDPTEARDLARERPDELSRLTAELEDARTRLGLPRLDEIGARASGPALDPATEQRLRELGYIK
jgi:arylsulfatase A-like enzyme